MKMPLLLPEFTVRPVPLIAYNRVAVFFFMIFVFSPNKLHRHLDQRLECSIRFQCIVSFSDLPNGILSEAEKQWPQTLPYFRQF
jgi:hypothetical protein